ncbi:ABC transporter substrate-binding protein [Desulfosediminicola sp.]|uniref:ABC transporter substrate-binding protein n=1 Tax=Desulfosediminicola sp. TaxID=2886825 RepID=UPI003AF2F2D4
MKLRQTIGLGLFALFLCTGTAVASDDLKVVQEKGEITMAMSGQYPPFNFVDDQNHLTGFDVEIGNEIAKRIDVKGTPVSTAWDGIIAGLLANKYELICGSMAITEERLKSIDFSDPYYRSGAQLFVKKGSALTSVADLDGKKVGVTLGTTYEKWVRENIPNVDIRTYKGVPDMILEVSTGRIDGFITDRIVGALAIKKNDMPIDLAGDLLYEEKMGIAMRKGNTDLKKAVDTALAAMKEDGSYHDISMKWLGIDVR